MLVGSSQEKRERLGKMTKTHCSEDSKDVDDPEQCTVSGPRNGFIEQVGEDFVSVTDESCALAQVCEDKGGINETAE